jgi:hypothetical protein
MSRGLRCTGAVWALLLPIAGAVSACGGSVSGGGNGGLDSGVPPLPLPLPPITLPDASRGIDAFFPLPPRGDGGMPPSSDATTDAEDADDDTGVSPTDAPTGDDSGGDDSGEVDSGFTSVGPDGGWNIAAHYPMPQVVDFGQPLITAPVFTAITYPSYDLETEAVDFVGMVGTSAYWSDVVSEYGVGNATVRTPIAIATDAPTQIDDSQIQTWLAGELNGSNAAFGTPTDQSLYVIFYPTSTKVTLENLSSCVAGGFGGYHNSVALTSGPWSNLNVSYAVVPECSVTTTAANELTEDASHELVEAVTDPLPLTMMPSYVQVDQNDFVWEVILGGGELADMCAQNQDAEFTPTGFTTPVQRIWSNRSAAGGHDPCQPSPVGQFYFNATARLDASVTITDQGQQIQTEGLQIPLNTSATVEVDLYSDGPVDDWTVGASDLSDVIGGGPYLDFSWDATTGNNGTKLHLTITPVAASTYGGEPFIIESENSAGTYNFWIGYVAQ